MPINNLYFFDKNGDEIPMSYDDINKIWIGKLYFNEVSVDLIENETIYVAQKVDDNFVHPQNTMNFVIKDNNEFKIFKIDSFYNDSPKIQIVENLQILPKFTNETARIDIMLSSKDEGSWYSELFSEFDNKTIKFELFGDTIGEDERFSILLSNMGEFISDREEFIFRASDINEELPNFKILNAKRKEFLVEFNNLKPYFSAYKGLINIIKFFGYHDLVIKEKWRNLETKKNTFIDVDMDSDLDKPKIYYSDNWDKLSELGLFYRINRVTSEYNDSNLPIVEDVEEFSHQEIIIKLFGLKKYIDDRNIGGASRIVDIIGEATFFHRYSIISWFDQCEVFSYDQPTVSFSIDRNFGFIEDIRPIVKKYSNTIPQQYNTINDIKENYIGLFSPLNHKIPKFVDEPNIPIGYIPIISNTTFDMTFGSAECTFDLPNNINFGNIYSHNFYRIKWKIVKQITNQFPEPFEYVEENDISNLHFKPILKKRGIYDVHMHLYSKDGNVFSRFLESAIEVDIKEPRIISWFRYFNPNNMSFNTNKTFGDIQSGFDSQDINDVNIKVDDIDTRHRSFKMVSYINLESEDKRTGLTTYNFGDIKHTFGELENSRFDFFGFDFEKLARFQILKSGTIEMDQKSVKIENPIFTKLSDLKNVFGNFNFISRPINNPTFIDATSNVEGSTNNGWIGSDIDSMFEDGNNNTFGSINANFGDVNITFGNTHSIKYVSNTPEQFGMDNTVVMKQPMDIPPMTVVFFASDFSKIAGKTKIKYILSDQSGDIVISESAHFCFRFDKIGTYNVSINITDSEGNNKTIKMDKHIKVVGRMNYKNPLY